MPEEKKYPKKITPDPINDAIVEIRYTSDIPYELHAGMFYSALYEEYKYIFQLGQTSAKKDNNLIGLTVNLAGNTLFHSDILKIQIRPNSISFNCNGAYCGWTKYSSKMKDVLTKIYNLNMFKTITRIGVRYTNIFKEDNVTENLVNSLQFKIDNKVAISRLLNTEVTDADYRVIIKLGDGMKLKGHEQIVSLLDIDVVKNINSQIALSELIDNINNARQKEKEYFFDMLAPTFIQKFNPEYEEKTN